jgi:MFS family permease
LAQLGPNEVAARGSARWFILLLGLIYVFNFIDRTIVSVLGEAIRRDLHLNDVQLGTLGGFSFALFFAALGIPLARLAERRNRIGIIAAVTALWSIMTALSGAAANFVQLLLCRVGVAIGEAGLTPSLVSMISDRFPPERRAAVYSMITLGASIGSATAAILGGMVAKAFGWRVAFFAMGLPGLLLALAVFLAVPEPVRRKAGNPSDTPSFGAVLRRLGRSPAFLHLTVGSGFVGLVGFGLNLFLIPLLVRRYGLDLAEAGGIFAGTVSFATILGSLSGGLVADRLGRRDVRWYGWAPALTLTVALPFYVAALLQDDWRWLVALMFVACVALYAFLPAVMTVTQRLVEPRMRASAAALHAFGQTVAGLGIGSISLGFLSDRLAARAYVGDYAAQCVRGAPPLPAGCRAAAAEGLQHAMIGAGAVLLIAILHYLLAARALPAEIRD